MELCNTCKQEKCNKKIVVVQEEKTITIKCLEYVKDKEKIEGYKKPLTRTAKLGPTLMKGIITWWE